MISAIEQILNLSPGNLVQATDDYHRNYAHFKWDAYRDFSVAEVISVSMSGIVIRDIADLTGFKMDFSYPSEYLKKI